MSEILRVGIAGLGTVGASVVRLLDSRRNALALRTGRAIQVTAVSARDKTRDRGIDLSGVEWYDDPVALAASPDIDLFVELIGGEGGAAKAAVETALATGKHVVTANKALIAHHGRALAELAEEKGVALAFEASVAGGIPIIKTVKEGLAGNTITRIYGILNGTCNYILTRMEKDGDSFSKCLKQAQKLGYAEADPTFDIGGYDTAHKLTILTALAFGVNVNIDAVYVEGIDKIDAIDIRMARKLGYRIKLLGVAERSDSGIEQRVHPTMVPSDSPIARIMGVTNAVTIQSDAVDELTLSGPGAGGDATASAVLADIADVASGAVGRPFGPPVATLGRAIQEPIKRHEGGYYIRLTVADKPGAAASIVTSFADMEISLESIIQNRSESAAQLDPAGRSGAPVPVVVITYATTEAALRKAVDKVIAEGYVVEKPQVIRIERE
ncbi:homoserine dehydrogenase [Pseudochelatococcus contaminans]|uniref:Homoserine dehydrogenase n=1 Tax=Pseudochelatococcus contaminans TaxID=1538103 RepID=A0A7W5Z4C8_9HYPH|nr:homoserine dehydrogenase [Pseudochelatococcus contaminans]MBB3809877.1 homoserine dehydrogenase [Pseudochelatococcus contaminans]